MLDPPPTTTAIEDDATVTAVRLAASDLQIAAGRRRRERVVKLLFTAAAVLSIVISLAIILSLIGNALTFFISVDKSSLWTDGWFPRRGLFDIKTIVVGTLVISAVAMVVATPLGLGAGIYLSEYASPRVRRSLKPIIEILASIPSVVLGFFALTWISPNVIQPLTDAPLSNMAAAGIAVGVLITPLIASVSEDAMHAVPAYLREASYGLGARRRTTTMSVVVPAAVSGIVAALIIGVSRAIGETMIVAIAAGGDRGVAVRAEPARAGADHDRRDDLAGHRLRPGARRREHVREPLLRRLPAVRGHACPEPDE